jgi:hypothetical protein
LFVKDAAFLPLLPCCISVQVVPPTNFELSREREPAFFYLADQSETARQAVKILSYLITKHHIGDLTQQEREAIGTKLLVDKDVLKYLKQQDRR